MVPADASSSPRRARPWRDLALNFLPGMLVGCQLAGLLFFLNPDLPFGAQTIARAALILGTLLGLATAVLLTPLTRRRPGRAARLLPWSLAVVLAVTALAAWQHAAIFGYFIPPGINVRLIKAALWLTVAGLICFYTALLHSLQMRPYGLRTRIGLAAVALVSVVVLVERREAFEPSSAPPPLPSTLEPEPRPRLIVVGLDSATLDAALPLARQGQLPFFARILEQGSHGRLACFSPLQREALWTSIATGKLPYKHGVLSHRVYPVGFLRRDAYLRLLPAGVGEPMASVFGLRPRPLGAAERRALTAWEVLARQGVTAGAIGWPATAGSPPGPDFVFSDRYFSGDAGTGSAQPQELAERGVLFRVGTDELDPDLVAPFGAQVPHDLLRALAGDRWIETLSVFLVEQRRDLRAVFVLLPGLREVSERYFSGYSAVQFDGASDHAQLEAARFVTAYYRHLDAFIAGLWERQPGPRLLAVVSAHGVSAPRGLGKAWAVATGGALEGRFGGEPDGVLMLLGEGVQAGTFIQDAGVIDVAPTLLYAMRLPIAEDLDGTVLTGAFSAGFLARRPLAFVPSYETLAPAAVSRP